MPRDSDELLTIIQAAAEEGCHPFTIRRAIWAGLLPAARRGATGPYRIRRRDFERWQGKRRRP